MAIKWKLKSDTWAEIGKILQSGYTGEPLVPVQDTKIVRDTVQKSIADIYKSWTGENLPTDMERNINEFIKVFTEDGKLSIKNTLLMVIVGVASLPMLFSAFSSAFLRRFIEIPLNVKFRPTLLDTSSSIDAWRRGRISEKELNTKLSELGYTDFDIGVLKTLAWYIPNAPDIIRFMVREVYDPFAVREWEMDKYFDELYDSAEDDSNKAGIDKDTLRKYWRAHWVLPSLTMGYEMLHRGVISKDELERLMRMQDIMPGWIDKLISISYVPYTRVDVRRMHKLGVISDDELIRAYKDLGYDDEHAKRLAEFTIKYNADPEETEKTGTDKQIEEFKNLSRSDVLRGYRLGIIEETDARDMLRDIGYSDDAIEYYISRENYLKEEETVDKLIKLYHEGYIKGIYDKTNMIEIFGRLNLPSSYQQYLLSLWDLEILVKTNLPTKSEILGWYKKGLIDEDIARRELRKHKYSEEYINWYIESAKD